MAGLRRETRQGRKDYIWHVCNDLHGWFEVRWLDISDDVGGVNRPAKVFGFAIDRSSFRLG
jgi:hypothetical protein